MALFSYVAINNNKESITGTVEQPDRASAIAAIVKQDLRPVSVKELAQKKEGFDFNKLFRKDKVKTDQLVMFTRQLSAMIGAGVPILRALSSLADHVAESPALKKILLGVIKDVEGGLTLGDALAKYPNTFNDVYVNMIRAGEAAGILDDILKRLAAQQEKSSTMRKKIKSAMSYPMVLMVITALAFLGLMFFVVPQIGKIITDLGGEGSKLPFITVAMLGLSQFMLQFWYLIIGGMFGLVYGILTYIKTPRGKFQFDHLMLRTPVIKKIVMKIAVAHFARTFSALIEAGVAVLEALVVTSRAVGNSVYEKALLEAEVEVKNGRSLSSVIEGYPIFPPIVSQMLLVGEETGQTDKILVKVADFYEEEVDVAIDGMSSIIEPIMIVVMGGMVGVIAASVMMPIAGLATSIKG